MALVESVMNPLGFIAPKFDLIEPLSGNRFSFDDLAGQKGTLVIVMCNHCPYVIHVLEQIVDLTLKYKKLGINSIAINSNDVTYYPDDAPHKMAKLAKDLNFSFKYLFDDNQQVAKSLDAACTPDFFLFDKLKKCYYRGRLDGSTPGNEIALTGSELRTAMETLLEKKTAPKVQKPSIGCSIKWKN